MYVNQGGIGLNGAMEGMSDGRDDLVGPDGNPHRFI